MRSTGARWVATAATVVVTALLIGGRGAASSPPAAFTAVGSPVVLTGSNPNPLAVAFSPDGKLVAVADSGDHEIWVYAVAGDGSLTTVSGSPFSTGAGSSPMAVAFDPQGPYLAVADEGNSSVSLFLVNGTAVTSLGSASTEAAAGGAGAGPQSLAFSPDGLLLATADNDGHISMFSVGGGLTPVSGSPFAVTPTPFSLAFSPSGDTLATADANANAVSLYAVVYPGPTLPQVAGSPLSTGASSHPVAVSFSRDGSLLAAADRNDDDISEFQVNTMTQVSGSPFPLTTSTGAVAAPDSVAFSPGSDVLSAGTTSGTANVFLVGSGGSLTAAPGSPISISSTPTPIHVAFGRKGGLLATIDEFNASLGIYSVGPPTAAISTPAAGATYTQGASVATNFACSDATAAPGIATCTDSAGTSSPAGHLDTSTLGAHTYTVTATSADGQSAASSVHYTVQAAPAPGPSSWSLEMSVTPATAGTKRAPRRVAAAFRWTAPGKGSEARDYGLLLPSGLVEQESDFLACGVANLATSTGFVCPSSSVIGSGKLALAVGSGTCQVKLALVAGGSSGMLIEFQPVQKAGCPTAASPVAVQVGADGHIAGSPITLRFALPTSLTGLASSEPGGVARYVTGGSLSFPLEQPTATAKGTFLVSDNCPATAAGREWRSALANGGHTTTAAERCHPTQVKGLPKGLRAPTTEQGPVHDLSGTVLQQIPNARSFVLDDHGQMLLIHVAGLPPAVGSNVVLQARRIANGTVVATCLTVERGHTKTATIHGVISDPSPGPTPTQHVIVLSGGGASVAIIGRSQSRPPLYHSARITVTIGAKSLTATSVHVGRPYTGKLAITGVLESAQPNQGSAGDTIQLSTDDLGASGSRFDIVIKGGAASELGQVTGIEAEREDIEVSVQLNSGHIQHEIASPKFKGEISVKRLLPVDDTSGALWQWFDKVSSTAAMECKRSVATGGL